MLKKQVPFLFLQRPCGGRSSLLLSYRPPTTIQLKQPGESVESSSQLQLRERPRGSKEIVKACILYIVHCTRALEQSTSIQQPSSQPGESVESNSQLVKTLTDYSLESTLESTSTQHHPGQVSWAESVE